MLVFPPIVIGCYYRLCSGRGALTIARWFYQMLRACLVEFHSGSRSDKDEIPRRKVMEPQTECPSFIDSTQIKVCHNLRIKSNKVFRELAKRGKTGAGWFYRFKVHLVISDCGDLLAVMTTPGNVDDRKPGPRLARRLFGMLFGDRGHISKGPF